MITLIVGNSYSQLTGLSPKQEQEVRKALSYTVGGSAAFFSGYGVRKKCLMDKKGFFPTGLIDRLPDIAMQVDDIRIKPKVQQPIVLTGVTPYHAQTKALHKAMQCHRGTISMPTGTGKSLVIALIASRLNLKTLVVVPSLEIKKQLQETLKALKNVIVENIDSKAFNSLTGIDCLIIDEAHHVAAKTYQKLNKRAWAGIYYRFFLTATPFRNDTEETLLFESIAGKVIYKLDYIEAIGKGYIVPVEAYTISIPKQSTETFTYREVYNELVVNNTVRNTVLSHTLQNLENAGLATLCLVREVRHGQILSMLTGLPFVSGEDDESRDYIRQFNNGQIKVLIGTTGILGEGIDTKPCEYVIIAGLGKAKSQFMQQVGRSVRKYPGKESAKVILIRDPSHRFLLKHYNAQRKILLEEYGVSVLKINL